MVVRREECEGVLVSKFMMRCVMKTYAIAGGGGLNLRVEETGNPDGKSLLFIHGFSQCRLAWRKQMCSDLAREFRLVTMDIRGHGLSDKPRGAYSEPELWAQDVHAVITVLGLNQPVLIGWSYGGVIMSDYLGVFGDEAIAGTQWVGAVPRLGGPLVEGGFLGGDFLALVPGFFSDDVIECVTVLQRFLKLCVHEEPLPEDFYFFLGYNTIVPPYVREGLFARNVNNDAVIHDTRKPVSLVYGEADQIVSPRMCTHMETLVPQATVSTYPNVGHMPFWEAPERFNHELRDFRNRV
jgi:non-heme chloroperoxidase